MIGGGILDIAANVLQIHRADITDAKAKLRELTGEEKKAAAARIKAQEDVSNAIDKGIQQYSLYGAAAATAFQIAKKGFDDYRDDMKMAAAAASIDIARIEKAFGGLKTTNDVMAISAKAANGAWKLNTQQLEEVAEGMRALEKKGHDVITVTNAITDVMQTGKTRGLREFGIAMKETGNRAVDLQEFLAAMNKEAASVGHNFDQSGDGVMRAGVKTQNAIDNISASIGQLVVAMEPLIASLADTAQQVANIANYASQIPGLGGGGGIVGTAKRAGGILSYITPWGQAGHVRDSWLNAMQNGGPAYMSGDAEQGAFANRYATMFADQAVAGIANDNQNAARSQWQSLANPFSGRGSAYAGSEGQAINESQARDAGRLVMRTVLNKIEATAYNSLPELLGGRPGEKGSGRGGGGFTLNGTVVDSPQTLTYYHQTHSDGPIDKETRSAVTAGSRDLDKYMGELRIQESMDRALGVPAANESMLSKIFGPVSEFELYTTAWQGLESVVTAGLNAWIDGSKSAGEAMKQALHGFAKQLAGEALLQALRHGAYVIGSLALGDGPSAAKHGIAAAKWGAVAVAASVFGKATNGAGAGSTANAAAGIGGGRAVGTDNGPRTTNVFLGDSIGYQSDRTTSIRFREMQRRAEARIPATGAVEFR